LNQVLDYTLFSAQTLTERIEWFDQLDWESVAETKEQRNIKQFFTDVFNNEKFSYLRKKAVEWISELALGGILRPGVAQEFLLDVPDNDGYITTAKVKYLFLLLGDNPQAYQAYEDAIMSSDCDIASEGYYRKGLVHLLYRAPNTSEATFSTELAEAQQLFSEACRVRENRVDAQFFGVVSRCIKELLAQQSEAYNISLQTLSELLWQRQIWGTKPAENILEWNIYRGLTNIKAIAEHTKNEPDWIKLEQEFTLLAKYFNDIVALSSVDMLLKPSYNQFANGLASKVLQQYYVVNLSAARRRIEAMLVDLDGSDTELLTFLNHVKASIAGHQGKKKDEPSLSSLLQLTQAFKHLTPNKITQDWRGLIDSGKSENDVLLELTYRYLPEYGSGDRTQYETGFVPSEQVLQVLSDELRALLIGYPGKQWSIFLEVLSDIIRYAYLVETKPKEFFPDLYDPKKATEAVFHRDLHRHLLHSKRATYYRYEAPDIVGGGRLDITYDEAGFVIPIEIKKRDSAVTWAGIEADFLAQAQTYAVPHNQLGILVVFEVINKARKSPLPNFKDRFKVMHVPPIYGLSNSHPDYIVTLVIPVNRVSPSSYTKY
jgi:hypothetical protein